MSKELTERWRNGTLDGGWYFLEFENGSILPVYYCGLNREFEFRWDWKISKVLSRASYDQFSQLVKKVKVLEKQLDEANEVIKNMKLCMDDKYDYDCVAEDVDIYLERYGVK